MTINTEKNQITCIYNSGSKFSDQLEAFLASSDKRTFLKDISKSMPTDTQWHDMAKRLDTSLKTFMNEDVVDGFDDATDYSEEGLVKILSSNPDALYGAIVMEENRIAHIKRYTELLEFYNVDSAGLKKTFHTEDPVTKRQTDEDSFI